MGANCEEDASKMLHNLDVLLAKSTPQPPRNDDQLEENFSVELMAGSGSQEENKLVF